jgi:hypothetical protein
MKHLLAVFLVLPFVHQARAQSFSTDLLTTDSRTTGVTRLNEDPRFTFAEAERAFAAAQPIKTDDVNGRWMLVGFACSPSSLSPCPAYEGYYPDGKLPIPGYAGFFHDYFDFLTVPDAFGNKSTTATEYLIGNQSKKVYDMKGPFSATNISTGIEIHEPSEAKVCAAAMQCRFVSSTSMLLCQMVNHDKRCGKTGTVHRYLGSIRAR